MNPKRFNEFRKQADILMKSSNWLTLKMDEAYRKISKTSNIEELKRCDAELEYLERRAYFEDTEYERFQIEYKDIIEDEI